jgi:hypothetical protein
MEQHQCQLNLDTLGQRIVQAARLAVAMHLYQAVDPDGHHGQTHGDDRGELSGSSFVIGPTPRQRVVIGGTGPRVVDDEQIANPATSPRRHG